MDIDQQLERALPVQMQATGIEAQVCIDIAERQQRGIAKYGTTVADNPLDHLAWLQHLYEELLDAAIYTKRCMAELQSLGMQADRDLANVSVLRSDALARLAALEMHLPAEEHVRSTAATLRKAIWALPRR